MTLPAPASQIQPEVDFDRLSSWMDDKALESGPLVDVSLLAGGTQNLLLRFRRGEREFVLRRPPLHLRANSNETMRREATLLAALAATDVPHPRLIAACEDDSVLGAIFYLMEPIDGFTATVGLPEPHSTSPDWRHRMGLALVEGIAVLGRIDHREVGLGEFGRPDKFLERQVGRWRNQLESYAEFTDWPGPGAIRGVETVAAWLEEHRPPDARPGILHGDYHLANVMYRFDAPELAAIVDWELATIGDPLLDLGWLLAVWPLDEAGANVRPWAGFPSSGELVAHYGRHSDRDLAAIDWYGVLACYKLGILLEGTHARACAGRADRATGDRLHAKTVALFERALGWIA